MGIPNMGTYLSRDTWLPASPDLKGVIDVADFDGADKTRPGQGRTPCSSPDASQIGNWTPA